MLMDGITVSNKIKDEIRKSVGEYPTKPTLAVCLVGEDPASAVYVRKKQEACEAVGMASVKATFSNKASTQEIVNLIKSWNADKHIHGILIQLPLPPHVNQFEVLESVAPEKDVDAFTTTNCGLLMHGRPRFLPCTPAGIIELFKHYDIALKGKNVVIVNSTLVVGQPLALMLLHQHSTISVNICHEHTKEVEKICQNGDILIAAVGKRPNFCVTAEMVKPGAVVVDVGMNREGKRIIGDVNFDEVYQKASLITPVPGGVGPCTVAMLLKNTLEAAKLSWPRKVA